MTYDVVIVGGGLAGSSAAIRCRQRGYSVAVIEKGTYPRAKLCGEFLSPEVQGYFADLGVMESVREAGAVELGSVLLSCRGSEPVTGTLQGKGMGLSRYALDALMVARAEDVGADVAVGTTVKSVTGELGSFEVITDSETVLARAVLIATGRNSRLSVKLSGVERAKVSPFVAFKAHYRGADLGDRIELHAFDGGYCGMSHVEKGLVNVCWISDKSRLRDSSNSPEIMQDTIGNDNELLRTRFGSMQRISDTFCAASQLTFRSQSLSANDILFVGDAAGMIAPLCGDGMAMAFKSGEIASNVLAKYFDEGGSVGRAYSLAWRREFATRIALGRWLHHGMIRHGVSRRGLQLLRRHHRLLPKIIRITRG